ncbi:16S rRNA (cytidine(1402)-2'-O)-methyltransferase [Wenzhouxiangella sp. AB-CW3]|uniref:16S rRNA (cytidine(1402)-2'-O)-methyltransferase n=1 Tax=Wenzhouxiangella sp. AB-CW3 TaxID=2771012 RepID=UPI00168BB70B|nr:16S rRNA (cytidine(1402)-2'-O)-methyltransferase [Wenzhouxiangella sp. AB-CW3]QOC23421.1 16S rRNA (cytidine(1402)-2'-O)-methyltransferase [Wenzhouxiangella sp. AB-CW3]
MNDSIQTDPAALWVVATPIGNLGDMSPRALDVLQQVKVVAAEDTRTSRRLFAERPAPEMISLHEHNESAQLDRLIERLSAGDSVALISDAGTPLVSDPGYRLVAAAHGAGIPVRTVPGPCAAIAALSVAGLPSDRFHFEGFLPARAGQRRTRLDNLADMDVTLIFYAPARDLPEILGDMSAAFGEDRLATLARELTKWHETVRRARLAELAGWVGSDPDQQRGEAVVVVAGNAAPGGPVRPRALLRELARELPPSRAAKVLARLTGMSRREAWALVEQNDS